MKLYILGDKIKMKELRLDAIKGESKYELYERHTRRRREEYIKVLEKGKKEKEEKIRKKIREDKIRKIRKKG